MRTMLMVQRYNRNCGNGLYQHCMASFQRLGNLRPRSKTHGKLPPDQSCMASLHITVRNNSSLLCALGTHSSQGIIICSLQTVLVHTVD